ncbi:MAG: DUF4091 domain-containing protein [Clostridia bacterium]|nr:DUF4091 domain-containing protein [Clostridia bacterium]
MNSSNLHIRIVSSLEKGLVGDPVEKYPELKSVSVLKGERLSFQLFMRTDHTEQTGSTRLFSVTADGADLKARAVRQIYADLPKYHFDDSDSNGLFIESESGLYPDVLEPLDGDRIRPAEDTLTAIWFEGVFDEPGRRDVTVRVFENGSEIASAQIGITVVDRALPAQELIFTQWFHCDCLASYYGVPVFSEEHWKIIGNFLRLAAENGINCILTPVLTPPLDTEIGGERPTVQLIGVTSDGDGYKFDFSLLKRYIDLALSCGIKYFEISHLFTQWGAAFAPKVVMKAGGEERRIFGWDTPGTEGEYPRFLAAFLPELVSFLKGEGILGNCRFHISDEPSAEHLENYLKAKSVVEPFLSGCVVIDALSSVDFFKKGIVKTPVPSTDHIEPFLGEDIKERWAYYCCGQWNKVGNRFIAYPAFRNRILGVQLYKFGISGFLQWGYDFYYSMGSRRLINPYLTQSGDGQVPSGDAFSVYPGNGGEPLPSTRLYVFYEAIQDMSALALCEKVIGREKVIGLIDGLAGGAVTFDNYPKNPDYILELREKINGIIAGGGL